MQYPEACAGILRFDIAVNLHNISGVLISINYIFFFFANLFTSNGRYYRIRKKRWTERFVLQVRYYVYGMFKHEEPPFKISKKRKFNPLQKLSYIAVMYIAMPVVILTGWAMMFPEAVFIDKIFGTSGLHLADLVHIIAGFVLSMFMFIHIYLCTVALPLGSSFRGMITGWHDKH
jgi:thiosulfate reductase cytochrome b subunit